MHLVSIETAAGPTCYWEKGHFTFEQKLTSFLPSVPAKTIKGNKWQQVAVSQGPQSPFLFVTASERPCPSILEPAEHHG